MPSNLRPQTRVIDGSLFRIWDNPHFPYDKAKRLRLAGVVCRVINATLYVRDDHVSCAKSLFSSSASDRDERVKPYTAIELTPTSRGFMRGEFTDQCGLGCSIQESSLATDDCIWLGLDEAPPAHFSEPGVRPARMHLTRSRAAALVPLLERFVATGRLGLGS